VVILIEWFVRYWYQSMREIDGDHIHLKKSSFAANLVMTALLSTVAAMLQSAGGFMPGIGYLISFLATLPIFLVTSLSIRQGILSYILSYILTILLLFIIQPSELIIFPFTTGLLGIAIGVAFFQLNKRILVVSFSSICLLAGIIVILYVFRFPVLGPTVNTIIDAKVIAIIFILSFFYSWLFVELCRIFLNRLYRFL